MRLWHTLPLTLCVAARLTAQDLVIRGTAVIDPDRGIVTPNRTIVVRQNRIVSVGGPSTPVPSGATVVEGRGTWAIPGLWDMHAHAAVWGLEQTIFPLNVANGITGIREMWGFTQDKRRLREAVATGALVGPRFVFAGNILDGWPPTRPGQSIARTPAEGRHVVDSLVDTGAEYIKVYSLLDSATFEAIARRATERGVPFAGHVPLSVSARYAASLGQRSMEHLEGVTLGCSTGESATLARRTQWLVDRARDSASAPTLMGEIQAAHGVIARTFDATRCDGLLRSLATAGVYQVPTLGVLKASAWMGNPGIYKADRRRFLAPAIRDMWDGLQTNPEFRGDSSGLRFHDLERRVVRQMARLDVPILAGTDSPNPGNYPGFGLHDELEALVSAGFTPRQALRSATTTPARYFAATDSLGSITPGKLADIVLLRGNPLRDIRQTRQVQVVVANGRLFRRAQLDSLLEVVATAAAK